MPSLFDRLSQKDLLEELETVSSYRCEYQGKSAIARVVKEKGEKRLQAALRAHNLIKRDAPHILPIADYEVVGDSTTLVYCVENLDTLAEYLEHALPSTMELISVGLRLADVLTQLHQDGIFHCSLSPSSIFVNLISGQLKLCDIDTSWIRSRERQERFVAFARPEWSAPEMLKEEPSASEYTDVYQFGLVMYYALTGSNPFTEESDLEAEFKQKTHEIKEIEGASTAVPNELKAIIVQCLKKRPEDRPPLDTVTERLRTCRRILSPEAFPRSRKETGARAQSFLNSTQEYLKLKGDLSDQRPGSKFLILEGPKDSGKSLVVDAALEGSKNLVRLECNHTNVVHQATLLKEKLSQLLIDNTDCAIGKRLVDIGNVMPAILYITEGDSLSYELILELVSLYGISITHSLLVIVTLSEKYAAFNLALDRHHKDSSISVPGGTWIKRYSFEPLTIDQIATALANQYDPSEMNVPRLASHIERMTGGNRKEVGQYLSQLEKAGALHRKEGTWFVDYRLVNDYEKLNTDLDIYENIKDDMNSDHHAVLLTIACCATSLDSGMISEFLQIPHDRVRQIMLFLVTNRLVIDDDISDGVLVSKDSQLRELLLREAMVLRAQFHKFVIPRIIDGVNTRADLTSASLGVAGQYAMNYGQAYVKDIELVRSAVVATHFAVEANRLAEAFEYIELAYSIISETPFYWSSEYSLAAYATQLYLRALINQGVYHPVEQIVHECKPFLMSFEDRHAVELFIIDAYMKMDRHADAVSYARDMLKELEFSLPRRFSLSIFWYFVRSSIYLYGQENRKEPIVETKDPATRKTLLLCYKIIPSLYMAEPYLFPIVVLKALTLALAKGGVKEVAPFFVIYGVICQSLLRNPHYGERFYEVALQQLSSESVDDNLRNELEFYYWSMVKPHSEAIKRCETELFRIMQEAVHLNNLEIAAFTSGTLHGLAGMRGQSLSEMEDSLLANKPLIRLAGLKAQITMQNIIHQYVANNYQNRVEPHIFKGVHYNETAEENYAGKGRDITVDYIFWHTKALTSLLFGFHKESVKFNRNAAKAIIGVIGMPFMNGLFLYRAIAYASQASKGSWPARFLARWRIRGLKRFLEMLTSSNRYYSHYALFLDALVDSLSKKTAESILKNFNLAYMQATKNNHALDAALVLEQELRYLENHSADPSIVVDKLNALINAYSNLQYMTKVSALRTEYGALLEINSHEGPILIDRRKDSQLEDLLLRFVGETNTDSIIEKVLNAIALRVGGQKCCLILLDHDQNDYRLRAIYTASKGVMTEYDIDIAQSSEIPRSLIQAVINSRNSVVTGSAKSEPGFSHDEYLQKGVQSVLAAPIMSETEVIGVIYCENNLDKDVFSEKEVSNARIIGAYAAAALMNAYRQERINKEVDWRGNMQKHFSNISHEIKTPINTALQTLPQLAKEYEIPRDDELYVRCLDTISQTARMATLATDFEKIRHRSFKLEAIHYRLSEVLRFSLNLVSGKLDQKKGVHARFPQITGLADKYVGDPGRIVQIFTNILENAIKFTDSGYIQIITEAVYSTDSEDVVNISFVNTGEPIALDNQQKIFGEFVQADSSTTRLHGGHGLGLSICRELSGLMGGTVYIDKESKNTCFVVKLPLKKVKNERFDPKPLQFMGEGDTRTIAKDTLNGIFIGLVDDDDADRSANALNLESYGAFVDQYSKPKEVLAALERERFDILLTDIEMPHMDGRELCRNIRKSSINDDMPILVLSATSDQNEISGCLEEGAQGFILKPYNITSLVEKIAIETGREVRRETEEDTKASFVEYLHALGKTQHVNVYHSVMYLGYSIDFISRKLKEFPSFFGAYGNDIQSALAIEEWSVIKAKSHILMRAAMTLGAFDLYDIANELHNNNVHADATIVEACVRECSLVSDEALPIAEKLHTSADREKAIDDGFANVGQYVRGELNPDFMNLNLLEDTLAGVDPDMASRLAKAIRADNRAVVANIAAGMIKKKRAGGVQGGV